MQLDHVDPRRGCHFRRVGLVPLKEHLQQARCFLLFMCAPATCSSCALLLLALHVLSCCLLCKCSCATFSACALVLPALHNLLCCLLCRHDPATCPACALGQGWQFFARNSLQCYRQHVPEYAGLGLNSGTAKTGTRTCGTWTLLGKAQNPPRRPGMKFNPPHSQWGPDSAQLCFLGEIRSLQNVPPKQGSTFPPMATGGFTSHSGQAPPPSNQKWANRPRPLKCTRGR